jgi:prepilin-type N-terminal cleavage/methylation domain-containing protein
MSKKPLYSSGLELSRAQRKSLRRVAVSRRSRKRASAFTLIEMLIALSIFSLMLVIIFVPLNQAFLVFNLGRSNIGLQQAAQQTLNTLEAELVRATHVFPNDDLPGVTDRPPYSLPGGVSAPPYYNGTACDNTKRVGNVSRLEFLVPEIDPADRGRVKNPVRPEKYVVAYYARRLNTDSVIPFDPYSNPVVLYRAQMPYAYKNGNRYPADTGQPLKVDTTPGRYASGTCDDGSKWLTHDAKNEPMHLSDLAKDTNPSITGQDVVGSHTLVTPRDMQLPVANPAVSLNPNISFFCEDVNGDGKIDRVTINLVVTQFDEGSGRNGRAGQQEVRMSQVVDLPNIR